MKADLTTSSASKIRSWKDRIAITSLFALILLVSLTAAFSIWRAKEDAISDWKHFTSSMGTLASQHADQTLAAADLVLSRLVDKVHLGAPADSTALKRDFGSREIYDTLKSYEDALPQVDVITIADGNGDVVNFSRSFPAPPINLADRDYFKAHNSNANLGLFLSEPVKNRGTGKWTFYLSRRLSNSKGQMIGLVLVGLESDYLGRFYESVQFGHGEPVLTLTHADGRVLARYPADNAVMGKVLKATAYRLVESGAAAPEIVSGPRATNPSDTRARIVWAQASSAFPVTISLLVTETLYLENWYRSSKQIAGAALLANAALLLAAFYIRRLLLKREQSEASLRALVDDLAAAERKVLAANEELEQRVAGRTELLLQANQLLDTELVERRQVESKLEKLARFDPLTGLPNRSLFTERLDEALAKRKVTDKLVGLMFVDLDHFKSVNDSYGHDVGDLVLREAGARMRSLLRHTDIASRMGGDEFTVIIEDVEELGTFQSIAEKLVAGFAAPLVVDNKELFLTLSVGVAVAPIDSQTSSDLMKQADFAMYHAKAEGRNGYQFHSATMEEKGRERMAIEHALRHALERNEFELYYQVRISATTNLPVGMEALARWNSPELGFVSPASFIPVAEDTGMIVDFGTWVLRTACRQHTAWRKDGLAPGVIGVNVSARQFRQSEFADTVAQIAKNCGTAPASIELEVTESLLMSDPVHAKEQMIQLRSMGFGIAIDDFGTGFSSLSHLKLFPATKLKIDRAFVASIDTNPQDQAIASAIVAMARTLDMTVTAEGVETPSQLSTLRMIACDEYQGFLFGSPQPVAAIREVLSNARQCASEAISKGQNCGDGTPHNDPGGRQIL